MKKTELKEEFPVGTGIYRISSSGLSTGDRVPCRYRDIPHISKKLINKRKSSL